MLPDDTKERRQAANDKRTQSMVTDHFKPQTDEDKPIPYSDKGFTSTAIEWLIDADLVSAIQTSLLKCTDYLAFTAASSLHQTILQEDD